jgi:DNA-binding transcriptional regulator YiaG
MSDEFDDEELELPDEATMKRLKALMAFDLNAHGRQRKRGVNKRPVAKYEDRRYIPAALRQWRRVHGLSASEAQARIGYSEKGNMWRLWEMGRYAPPYEALLRILAATGIGHWVDAERLAEVDPTLRLEVLTHQYEAKRDARRTKSEPE